MTPDRALATASQNRAASGSDRNGVRKDGIFVFWCAACHEVAATLEVTTDDREVDGGPVPGGRLTWRPDGPACRLDFVNIAAGSAPAGLVELTAASDLLDPVAVRRIDWELGSFCCRQCEQNYCRKCWSIWVDFDDGFYDCTRGRCPRGHEQMLDD